MIFYEKLFFENAFTYDKAEIPLKDQGIVGVLGKNGAGKSSIFEVLDHILFTDTAKGHARDAIINRHRPDLGYFGELEFKCNDSQYRIQQSRKHPKHGSGIIIFEDGHDITAKNTRRAEKQILEIINLSKTEFYNCVYLADRQSSILLYGTPTQRDSYLSSLFQLDIFDRLLEAIKEDHKNIQEILDGKQQSIFRFKEIRNRLEEIKKPEDDKIEKIRLLLKSKEELYETLRQKHKRWIEVKIKYAQRVEIEERIEKIGEIDPVEENQVEVLEGKLRKAERANAVRKQRFVIERKLESLPEAEDDLKILEKRLTKAERLWDEKSKVLSKVVEREEIEKKVEDIRSKVGESDIKDELKTISKVVAECEVQIEIYSKRYETLSGLDEAECPTCGSKIEDKETLLSEFEKQKKRYEHKHKKFADRIINLERLKKVADRLNQYESKLSDLPKGDSDELSKDFKKYSKLVSELRSQVRTVDLRSELEKQLQELPKVKEGEDPKKIREELEDLRNRREKFREISKMKTLLKALPESGPNEEHIKKLETKIQEVKDEVVSLELRIQRMEKTKKEWKVLHGKFIEMKKSVYKVKKYKLEESALDSLKSAFGRGGLRLLALRRVLQAITEALPKYVTLLFQEKGFKIKMAEDTFDFDIIRSGINIPKQLLSKGERSRLALALLLATRQAMPIRKRSNILVVDEVLDGLDEEGIPHVFSAFDYLRSEENVSSIFLISPMTRLFREKSLRDRLDTEWFVSKDKKKNLSTIEFS